MWGIAVKNLMILLVASATYSIVGYRLMYGASLGGLVGDPFDVRVGSGAFSYLFYQTGFAAVAATIVSGAIAERTTLLANVAIAVVVAGFVYPVHGHWVWGGGFLTDLSKDFAGSGAVHLLGGTVALAGVRAAGRRVDRGPTSSRLAREPKAMALVVCGVMFLWVGWLGFNGGSLQGESLKDLKSLGQVALNTSLAASGGGLAAGLLTYTRSGQMRLSGLDAFTTCAGAMGGMVAITACCDHIESTVLSFAIGATGGICTALCSKLARVAGLDDPVDAIAVHAGGGLTGMALAALVTTPTPYLMWYQLVDVGSCIALSYTVAFSVFRLLDKLPSHEDALDLDASPVPTGVLGAAVRREMSRGTALVEAPLRQRIGLTFDYHETEIGFLPVTGQYLARDLQEDFRLFMASIASAPAHAMKADREQVLDELNVIRSRLKELSPPGPATEIDALDSMLEWVGGVVESHVAVVRQIAELGKPESKFVVQPVPLASIVRERIEYYRDKFATVFDDIREVVRQPDLIEGDDYWVQAHPQALTHAIGNLLRNSIEAVIRRSEKGDSDYRPVVCCVVRMVRVGFRGSRGAVLCSVVDNGTGIEADAVSRLDEVFYSTKDDDKISGLGIPFTKYFVHLVGGSMALIYSEPNVGTVFDLAFLPAEPPRGSEM